MQQKINCINELELTEGQIFLCHRDYMYNVVFTEHNKDTDIHVYTCTYIWITCLYFINYPLQKWGGYTYSYIKHVCKLTWFCYLYSHHCNIYERFFHFYYIESIFFFLIFPEKFNRYLFAYYNYLKRARYSRQTTVYTDNGG